MNDDELLDLTELSRQWKEIDMPALKMTAETGRMQANAQISVWMMRGLLVSLLACAAVLTYNGALIGGLLYAAGAVVFGLFMQRQTRQVAASEEMLADGTPRQVLQARVTLLDVELYAWRSPGARFCELVLMPALTLGAGALWWTGMMPLWLPAGVAVFFISFTAWGRVRVPRLRQQRAEAQKLLAALEE